MANSPWGHIDYSTVFAPGFKSVGTSGHGGIMITEKFAEANLSEAAQEQGEWYGGYLCYEEDCSYAIPFWELLEEYGDKMFEHNSPEGDFGTQEKRRSALKQSLSSWNPEYLLAVGVQPDAEPYAAYRERKLSDKMRAERHPDLITSASRNGCPKGAVMVTTADRKVHFVTEESYDARMGLNLLSKLTPIS